MAGLVLRKLADQTGERVAITNPLTGVRELYEPDNASILRERLAQVFDGIEPSPYPFLGLRIENDGGPPGQTAVSKDLVAQGRAEGWLSTVPEEVEPTFRSSGPRDNAFGAPPHVFLHYQQVIFHTVEGDVVYAVTENPDKWPDEKEGAAGFGGEVRHFYELQLSGIHQPEASEEPPSEVSEV